MLLAADVVGMTIAFAIASVASNAGAGGDHVHPLREYAFFFFAVLPLWVGLAKLYGLYERDEEKADYSTVDDFLGVVEDEGGRFVDRRRQGHGDAAIGFAGMNQFGGWSFHFLILVGPAPTR